MPRPAPRLVELEHRTTPSVTVVPQHFTTNQYTAVTLTQNQLLAGDTGTIPLAASNPTQPANANLVTNYNGTFTFTFVPDPSFTGSTSFQYTVGAAMPQKAKLTAADASIGQSFGASVSVSGDTAVIGKMSNDGTSTQGAAYVFVRSGGVWMQQAKLTAADGAAGDFFGASVSINGDTVVIGAAGKSINGNTGQGAVYVFVRSGSIWSQQAEFTGADGSASDGFGGSVSLNGDTALIGASGKTVNGNARQGAAYVFVRSGNTWSEQAELTAADGSATNGFGGSVSLNGDSALIGAGGKPVNGNSGQGAAYVFVRSGTIWSEQAELTAADGAGGEFGDAFGGPGTVFGANGGTVSIDGNTAVIGAVSKSFPNSGFEQGAAYVFVRSGSTWSQQAELTQSFNVYFGRSVALRGDTLLIGSVGGLFQYFGPGLTNEYVRSGNTWSKQQTFTAADNGNNDGFGGSVSVDGDTAVIGAPYGNNAAYVDDISVATATATVQVKPATAQLTVSPASLPTGMVGSAYPGPTETATGGTGSGYTFQVSGLLPAGLTLNPATGQLAGTPAQAGYFPGIVIAASDGHGGSGSKTYTLTINSAIDELGAYRPGDGSWSLDSDGTPGFNSATDQVFNNFSPPGVTGVAGDWTGSGHTTIGDFKDGIWHLDLNGNGVLDPGETFTFGQAGDQPIVGDWNGDGKTDLGVFRTAPDGVTGEFILDTNETHVYGPGDETFTYGLATDHIIVGHWGGLKDGVGVYRDAVGYNQADAGDIVFSLDVNNHHAFDNHSRVFVFGLITDQVVIGDWTGKGSSTVGVYRDGAAFNAPGTALFSLDSGANQYIPGTTQVFLYGRGSDRFVSGHWAKTPPLQPEGMPRAQFAAGGAGPGGVPALTTAELQPVLNQAINYWAAAGVNVFALQYVQITIGQLDNSLVGWTAGNTITLDATAAGWGWSTDPGAPTPDKMDLLTVVEHEMGHELGLPDVDPTSNPTDLMASTLATGVRRQPSTQDVDAVFAHLPKTPLTVMGSM
jgi:hypothetical protein